MSVLAALLSFVGVLVGVKLLDLVCGPLVHPPDPHWHGLVFPPHSSSVYETSEFTFHADINGLGFRDREFDVKPQMKLRIVTLGDSFTYGWGVNVNQPWPKVVEEQLQRQGVSVEVCNLGCPGAGPKQYAEIARKAVPVLHPDLIVVGVLQGDDLEQSDPSEHEQPQTWWQRFALHPLPTLYPHLSEMIRQAKDTGKAEAAPMEAASVWKQQAPEIVKGLNPDERARFDAMNLATRQVFMEGHLNAAWVTLALRHPDYFVDPLHVDDSTIKARIAEMADRFRQIKDLGVDVPIVSLPSPLYGSATANAQQRRLGFHAVPEMLTTDLPDEATRRAAAANGLTCVVNTDTFRKSHDAPFFPLDGHLNAAGHRLMGSLLTPVLLDWASRKSSSHSQ